MTDVAPFQLLIHRDGQVESHDFDLDAVVLGRSRDCDLVLEDRLVSRRHCRVERRSDGTFALIDEGAQNPARLRGVPIDRAELR
ncbi:MAG: FHA domain-containing protein, partial [Planctomycetota bacterium]